MRRAPHTLWPEAVVEPHAVRRSRYHVLLPARAVVAALLNSGLPVRQALPYQRPRFQSPHISLETLPDALDGRVTQDGAIRYDVPIAAGHVDGSPTGQV